MIVVIFCFAMRLFALLLLWLREWPNAKGRHAPRQQTVLGWQWIATSLASEGALCILRFEPSWSSELVRYRPLKICKTDTAVAMRLFFALLKDEGPFKFRKWHLRKAMTKLGDLWLELGTLIIWADRPNQNDRPADVCFLGLKVAISRALAPWWSSIPYPWPSSRDVAWPS